MSAPTDQIILVAADSESDSCSDICSESGVSHDFLIWLVEGVLEIRVGGDAGGDGVPSAEIDAGVAGGVVDAVAEKI